MRIGADLRYSGLMTKNPLNPWPNCTAQWFRRAPYTLREWLPDEIPNRSSPAASAATDQRGSQFHGKHTANTPSSHRTVARTASGGMVGKAAQTGEPP